MSLIETKANLHSVLLDTDNKVIALTGKWGTGKSHLWKKVRNESQSEAIKNSLYVSLFGITDLSQVKIKIMQSAIPENSTSEKYFKVITTIATPIKTALKGLHRSLNALDELALLATPALFKNKFIVIDDVERKHEKLSIDEILGFIDEFSQKYNTRFLIILNSDKLAKRETWDTLREKVIDQELRLSTSPEEAFDIAAALTPSTYVEHIKKAAISCKINNIRIIRKIIKATNTILNSYDSMPSSVLSRIIPSTVLLAAINYKGIDNGPDFKYVLSANQSMNWASYVKDENALEDEESRLHSEWQDLFNALGIISCDSYELVVVDFLESGHLDSHEISKILNGYLHEKKQLEANANLADFKFQFLWNHKISQQDLITKASELLPAINFLNAATVTELHGMLSELPDGSNTAEELIQAWILNFQSNSPETYENDHTIHAPIHKDIQKALKDSKPKNKMQLNLLNSCMHIWVNNSWSTIHETTMRRATPMDFESAIYSMDAVDLRDFMALMTKIYNNKETYEKHFGTAGENFYAACQTIVNDQTFGRLSTIISRAINAKISSTHS